MTPHPHRKARGGKRGAPAPDAPRAPGPAPRRRVPAWVVVAAAALSLAVLGAIRWLRPRAGAARADVAAFSARFEDAVKRSDWVASVEWGERLVRSAPAQSRFLRSLAGARHNFAMMERGPGRSRPALRTSLERWDSEIRALREAEQALACATTPEERAAARFQQATFLDNAGFHAEALEQYERVLEDAPDDVTAAARVVGIRARMRDPAFGDSVSAAEVQALLAARH